MLAVRWRCGGGGALMQCGAGRTHREKTHVRVHEAALHTSCETLVKRVAKEKKIIAGVTDQFSGDDHKGTIKGSLTPNRTMQVMIIMTEIKIRR